MRKLLIAAPWIPAICAAIYVYGQWDRLPVRMAVTFYQGQPSGWQSKGAALPELLGLMFGILALLTAVLVRPALMTVRQPVAATLMNPNPEPVDAMLDVPVRWRLGMVAHWAFGFLMPLSIWHLVDWNLTFGR